MPRNPLGRDLTAHPRRRPARVNQFGMPNIFHMTRPADRSRDRLAGVVVLVGADRRRVPRPVQPPPLPAARRGRWRATARAAKRAASASTSRTRRWPSRSWPARGGGATSTPINRPRPLAGRRGPGRPGANRRSVDRAPGPRRPRPDHDPPALAARAGRAGGGAAAESVDAPPAWSHRLAPAGRGPPADAARRPARPGRPRSSTYGRASKGAAHEPAHLPATAGAHAAGRRARAGPHASLRERDRRWTALRAILRERRLDGAIVGSFQGRERLESYLIDDFLDSVVVFPLDGEPTVLAFATARISRAFESQARGHDLWVADYRVGGGAGRPRSSARRASRPAASASSAWDPRRPARWKGCCHSASGTT